MSEEALMNQGQFVNIAFYKFISLSELVTLRETFLNFCLQHELKGTVILSAEGINSCLVGTSQNIESFIAFMHADSRFADIEFKTSYSDHIPFRRMLVKIKKEIIPMGIPTIQPALATGKHVQALELKKWLDSGEDLILLDTRNNYEVGLGTFRGATNPKLKHFRDFTQWIKTNLADQKNKKIVTFCTGGIRCEKASALMQQEGFEQVYQLQGGILKYFAETMSMEEDNYYDGDCFVFDYRAAVDKKLQKTQHEICYNCWAPLNPGDVQHEHYKKEVHCHNCYKIISN